ncbi:methyltransferase [Methanoculleus sediminis]|uniref:Methyltransferase n=1 Tax=Methanoculleus sediminis TaxID=1550566 RepID=A0A0H1R012_9EURY|nr:tRNA (N6-threonylcarbamoyladenosine(37)-N6)-methyltransferase TrmO [Methanoculleus sediminis]KLK88186.1 methyltransferase [Methanoculleus sediminis]
MEVTYQIIGTIHSPFTDQDTTPIQSIFSEAEGTIEVFPEYADGLEGVEGFSHIILLYHFHRANGFSLRQRPFVDGSKERGIFAIRHFSRPNPIGISLVEVVSVEGNTVRVRGIDVLDGTPLLDIKPYVRQFDHRDEVRSGWVDAKHIEEVKVRSFSPKDLREHEESS